MDGVGAVRERKLNGDELVLGRLDVQIGLLDPDVDPVQSASHGRFGFHLPRDDFRVEDLERVGAPEARLRLACGG